MKLFKLLEKNRYEHPKEVEAIRGKMIASEIHNVGNNGNKYSTDDEVAILKKTLKKALDVLKSLGYSLDTYEFDNYCYDTEQAKINADKK